MAFNDSTLGENLREAREARGWSPSELAAAAGFTAEQVQAWESGRRAVRPQALYRLAQALGCPVASLFGEDESRLIPWNPNTGRLELCLHCGARDHPVSATHCGECGYQLETSQCPGQLEDAYLGMDRPCMTLVPPGQMHCQNCGTPSLWAELADRLPRKGPGGAITGWAVEPRTLGDLEEALDRLEELERKVGELRELLERLAGRQPEGRRGQVYRS